MSPSSWRFVHPPARLWQQLEKGTSDETLALGGSFFDYVDGGNDLPNGRRFAGRWR
jgi:hypothetical protein